MLSELCQKSFPHDVNFNFFPISSSPAGDEGFSRKVKCLTRSCTHLNHIQVRRTNKLLCLKVVLSRLPSFLIQKDWCCVEICELIVGSKLVVKVDGTSVSAIIFGSRITTCISVDTKLLILYYYLVFLVNITHSNHTTIGVEFSQSYQVYIPTIGFDVGGLLVSLLDLEVPPCCWWVTLLHGSHENNQFPCPSFIFLCSLA